MHAMQRTNEQPSSPLLRHAHSIQAHGCGVVHGVPSRHKLHQRPSRLEDPRPVAEARHQHTERQGASDSARGATVAAPRDTPPPASRNSTPPHPRFRTSEGASTQTTHSALAPQRHPYASSAVTSPPHIDLTPTPQRSCPWTGAPNPPPPPPQLGARLRRSFVHAHTQGAHAVAHHTKGNAQPRNVNSADDTAPPNPMNATHNTRKRVTAPKWSTRRGA
jgi:hypothetical protein